MIPFAANAAATAAAKIASGFEWPGQTPHIASSRWYFVTLSEQDRATAVGNMHRKNWQRSSVCFRDILADRQTDTQTNRHTHTDILITNNDAKQYTELPQLLSQNTNMFGGATTQSRRQTLCSSEVS